MAIAERLELPYHCPRLRGDFLRPPCDAKLREARAWREKFPGGMLLALEHCLECGGKELVEREVAGIPLDGKNQAWFQARIEEDFPPVENNMRIKSHDIPLCQKEDDMEYAGDIRPEVTPIPAAVKGLIPGQFCKHHPEVLSKMDKRGQYMGLCVKCLQVRGAKNASNRGKTKRGKDKMTPAVARDLKAGVRGQGSGEGLRTAGGDARPTDAPAMKQLSPEQIARGREAVKRLAESVKPKEPAAAEQGGHTGPPLQSPASPPMCLSHNLPIKFNAKGVSMGGCVECRREIASMGGHKARIKLAENPLKRVFAGHGEELAWLLDQARELLRSPEAQVVFLVKTARLQGGMQQ